MIGILNAYHYDSTPGNFQEKYNELILKFVQNIFPERKICHYKIAFGEWPKSVEECQAWFVTGSAKGAYDVDQWISQLKNLISELNKKKIKLIGICFGHQIIAESLGGRVEKSSKGWGVGVKNFQIIKINSWMNPEYKNISLLFSHQDQVVQLPPGAILLAQDQFCENQMVQIGDHILTFQGHPEFDVEFAKARLISRKDKMPIDTYNVAMNSLHDSTDSKIVMKWIRNFVLNK